MMMVQNIMLQMIMMMMRPMMMFCGTSTCVVVVPAANIGPPSSSAHTLPLKTLHRDQDDEEGFRRRVGSFSPKME